MPHPHRIPIALAVAIVVFLAILAGLVAVVFRFAGTTTSATSTVVGARSDDSFARAQASCDPAARGTEVAADGVTLLIDNVGKRDLTGIGYSAIACVLGWLDTPEAVLTHMDRTRSVDGRQSDAWAGYSASWTYHPDDGLDLVVRTG